MFKPGMDMDDYTFNRANLSFLESGLAQAKLDHLPIPYGVDRPSELRWARSQPEFFGRGAEVLDEIRRDRGRMRRRCCGLVACSGPQSQRYPQMARDHVRSALRRRHVLHVRQSLEPVAIPSPGRRPRTTSDVYISGRGASVGPHRRVPALHRQI
jgi:hypothetical protein